MRTLLGGTAAALVLVASLDVTTYAATGDSLILGKVNSSAHTTEVRRTTAGAGLKITTKPGSPPLAVSSPTRVARLNADRVDGLEGASLQTRTTTFTDPDAQTIPASSDLRWNLPLPAGMHHIEYGVGLIPVAAARIECSITSAVGDGPTNEFAFAVDRAPSAGSHYLSGGDVVTIAAGATTYVQCVAGATDLVVVAGQTPRVHVTRVDTRSAGALTPANF